MTPGITPKIMADCPLCNFDPKYFVAKKPIGDLMIKRCWISDFMVVAFGVLMRADYFTSKEVDFFGIIYTEEANVRYWRKHEG
jgi:hypothetical protein